MAAIVRDAAGANGSGDPHSPVLTAALYARFASRDETRFAGKALSAMRAGFGGHLEPKKA